MTILINAPPSPLYLVRRTKKAKRRWGNNRCKTLSAAVETAIADKALALAKVRGLSRSALLYRLFNTIDQNDLWDLLIDGNVSDT